MDAHQVVRGGRRIGCGKTVADDLHVIIKLDAMLARSGEPDRLADIMFLAAGDPLDLELVLLESIFEVGQIVRSLDPEGHAIETRCRILDQNELMMFPLVPSFEINLVAAPAGFFET